jgi:hypothetical protein
MVANVNHGRLSVFLPEAFDRPAEREWEKNKLIDVSQPLADAFRRRLESAKEGAGRDQLSIDSEPPKFAGEQVCKALHAFLAVGGIISDEKNAGRRSAERSSFIDPTRVPRL